jgi:omega-amidase
MNIVCCQLDIVWEDKPTNHAKVRAMVERARPERESLVVLPEMFATGFSMNIDRIRDDQTRESQQFLGQLAREFGICIVAGIVTAAPDGRGRNEAVVISSSGQEVARYSKMHPFSYGGEAKHYESGRSPVLLQWRSFNVAPFICYDLRFPEVFRHAVRRGAQLFTVIANWPAARAEHWLALLRARAIENQAYVAGVNRCGSDPRLDYSGRTVIIDPRGDVLVDAGGEEGAISTELDLDSLLAWRQEFPALADIRPEYLSDAT